jgi:archaellum biogenesis protein FlaJ (TadC family)
MKNMGGTSSGSMDALAGLPTFQFFSDSSGSLQLLNMMVTAMLITLTVVNASAIRIVEGGHMLKFLFYLGIMLAISGVSLLLIPDMLKGIFGVIGTVK